MSREPAMLTASEALLRMRSGELSVEAMARTCLTRIAARDESVRAWTYIDADLVLAEARELDRRGPSGPLHGLPIGVKDVLLTENMPTQYNSPIYQGFHPRIDASCVAILRAAGALIFGKTDTVEFAATGRKALTRNPHDLTRTPGGSSSGSAAAVADFHVPVALGTQTGGSIIRPASFCGIYGMKPTWNLVSNEGAKMFSASLDTIGWYGRSAEDLRLIYDVFDPEPPTEPDLEISDVRVAICRTPIWNRADSSTQDALTNAAEMLRRAGAQVVDLELPPPFGDLPDLQSLVMRAEARATFLSEYRAHYSMLGESFREQVENIDGITRDQLCAAYDVTAQCRADFDKIASEYHAVLTPSVVGEAPEGLASTGEYIFNGMWTLLHVPCVNVPGFRGPNDLPIGLTVTGRRFSDRRVLAAAEMFGRIFAEAAGGAMAA